MNAAMTENPPLAKDAALLKQFALINVGPGQDVNQASEATKSGLARAAKDGLAMLNKVVQNGMGNQVNGWTYPLSVIGRAGLSNQFLTRASVQCLGGIIANEPHEATYLCTFSDVDGQRLRPGERYTMHFAKDNLPPINQQGFWSLSMYGLDYNFVDNEIDRYSIGDRTEKLMFDEDGGLTLYIQNNKPEGGKVANWLPSPSDQEFYMVLRIYLPKVEIVNQTWQVPGVKKTQ